MITFVLFHVDPASNQKKRGDHVALINLFFSSAKHFHPTCRRVLLTDMHSDMSPWRNQHVEIKRYDVKANEIMLSRSLAQELFLNEEKFETPYVLSDYDVLINSSLTDLFDGSFDVGLTYRTLAEFPHMKRPDLLINGGVYYIGNNHPTAAHKYFSALNSIYLNQHSDSFWWGQQESLIEYVGSQNVPSQGTRQIKVDDVRVTLFPYKSHNFTPEDKLSTIQKPFKGPKLLHFKGKRRRMMNYYHDMHQSSWVTWKSLKSRIQYSMDLLKEKQTGHTLPKKALKEERKKGLLAKGKAQSPLLDSHLKRVLEGQDVLILGSGPSASTIREIPEHFKILTCNGGLHHFTSHNSKRMIDIYFMVRSKLRKTLPIPIDSKTAQGETENISKVRWMEGLIKQSKIDTFISNDINLLESQDPFEPFCQNIVYDDPKDNRYFNTLLKDIDLSLVQDEETIWTSTGLRLLQYALFFKARTIYIAGIDLGQSDYFWGKNPNPWKHTEIDALFVREISKRFSNVFSASETSPITQHFPYKPLYQLFENTLDTKERLQQ